MDNNTEEIEDAYPSCIYEEPELTPRIGHQYQAEIPFLLEECDLLWLIGQKPDAASMGDGKSFHYVELPLPVMWSSTDEAENINGVVEFENCKESQITLNGDFTKVQVENTVAVSGGRKGEGCCLDFQSTLGNDKKDIDFVSPCLLATKLNQVEKGLFPFPDLMGQSWTDIERDSFLLGLYIFEKDFFRVKKFVQTKEMGDILSFYYGKFYGSKEHRRWSDCRKLRSKRCVVGEKILTGWRQQELLSRLCSYFPEESKCILLEVSKSFEDGRISFEEYVFRLKDALGVKLLIQAVGIGKGKRDLTRKALEPTKAIHVLSVHHEIPVGKACSSLSSDEIIKLLTGSFRLSKARSSDIFWEAVWPRLLARGWHSEQPKDHGVSGLNHALVFLTPGVKRFSRRRLVKGSHYFDSVSDVLNKVASEPGLLELEMDTAEGNEEKGNLTWNSPIKDYSPTEHGHHCYQRRERNCNRDLMKFTIIDTSIGDEEGQSNLRELRCLPSEITGGFTSSSLSSETEASSKELEDEEETNTSSPAPHLTETGVRANLSDCVAGRSDGVLNVSDPIDSLDEDRDKQNTSLLNYMEPAQIMNHQPQQYLKLGHSNLSNPSTRRQGLIACSREESSWGTQDMPMDIIHNEDMSKCLLDSPDACAETEAEPYANLPAASTLDKSSPKRINDDTMTECSVSRELTSESIANVLPDPGTDEAVMAEMVQNVDNLNDRMASFQSEINQKPEAQRCSVLGPSTGQQPTMNIRRQSARNRQLTTRALEALEYGFLSAEKKRKGEDAVKSNPTSRPARRVRPRTSSIASAGVVADSSVVESGSSMAGKPQI